MAHIPPITPHDPQPLRDRVVLVTGGAQGIGRGIAQGVLGAGGRVAIGDVDADAGAACLVEWDVGDRALFAKLDVTREASVRTFVRRARDAFGRVDGLVNNAGFADPEAGDLAELTLADWRRWLDSHLTGAFLCCKHALPALRESDGGAIVNIGSTRAHQSEPQTAPYAAAKGGLVALTHALAISEGPRVRANVVSPGWIAVDAWRKPSERHTPKLSKKDHVQHPAGRVGTPEDIASLVVWLLSPQAGFVTGAEFVVDGGMSRAMRYA